MLGKLGLLGVVFTLPMLMMFAMVVIAELVTRRLSTAVMGFGAACAAVIWLVR